MYTLGSSELEGRPVGAKATRLRELMTLEVPVPDFLVVPGDVLEEHYNDREMYVALAKEVQERLPAAHYAVRSAALPEDGKSQSMAGRFCSEVPVAMGMLPTAIAAVLDDAHEKLPSLGQFSLMIQVVVEPDYSGVIFTRDPHGAPEMVLAYTDGYGEKVVGGSTVKTVRIFDDVLERDVFPGLWELRDHAANIEAYYEFPQDIEFVVAGGEVHIVQARPITSISDAQWQGLVLIEEEELARPYYLAQDTLSESFSLTSALGFSIIEHLYRSGGPVEAAYTARGIIMQPGAYFRHIGGSVYIDKEREAHSIYPAFGYFRKQDGALHLERVRGLWQSLKNFWRMHMLRDDRLHELKAEVVALLQSELPEKASIEERLALLDAWYAVIFEINLTSQAVLQRARQAFGDQQNLFADVISSAPTPEVSAYAQVQAMVGKSVGNSIAFDDESVFTVAEAQLGERTPWREAVPRHKRVYLDRQVLLLEESLSLRELGRWASVMIMSYVRDGVMTMDGFADREYLHYTLEELQQQAYTGVVLKEREAAHRRAMSVHMPTEIISFAHKKRTEKEGLASGVGQGVVVDVEGFSSGEHEHAILRTPTLTPDLAPLLLRPELAGIITAQGNILSHMAILAREQRVPIVRTEHLPQKGEVVRIDGGSGVIESV